MKSILLGLYVELVVSVCVLNAQELTNSSEYLSYGLEKVVAQNSQVEIGRPIDLSNPTGSEDDSDRSEQLHDSSEEFPSSFDEKLGLGKNFEGVWGLSEDTCVRTRKIEDIFDDQTLAIKGDRIYFIDSQCLILETKRDHMFGQTAKIKCIDVDGQSVETELSFKPIGALKLEISSNFQNSREYVYCAGIPD